MTEHFLLFVSTHQMIYSNDKNKTELYCGILLWHWIPTLRQYYLQLMYQEKTKLKQVSNMIQVTSEKRILILNLASLPLAIEEYRKKATKIRENKTSYKIIVVIK